MSSAGRMYRMTKVARETRQTRETRQHEGLAAWLWAAVRSVRAGEWRAQKPARKHMHVVETLTLGPRKNVVLMSCDGERFLVSLGAEQVGTMVRVRPERFQTTVPNGLEPDGLEPDGLEPDSLEPDSLEPDSLELDSSEKQR